jgi:hypothetical protein
MPMSVGENYWEVIDAYWDADSPQPRPVQPPESGRIVSFQCSAACIIATYANG